MSDFEASAQADASFRSPENNNASLPYQAEGRRLGFADRAFERGLCSTEESPNRFIPAPISVFGLVCQLARVADAARDARVVEVLEHGDGVLAA